METLLAHGASAFYYLWFVVVLGVVVFVHEFGHYIVGRWCGIHAEVFSVGFGREIFGWNDRRGTRWRIGILPLGGYVKYLGDADGSSRADPAALARMGAAERARTFAGAAVWRRALAVAAGPVFNFALSILVFAGLAAWFGKPVESPVVGIAADVPGYETGLRTGDRLVEIAGKPVTALRDLYTIARGMPEPGPLPVRLVRAGETVETTIAYPLPALVGGVQPFAAAWKAGLREGDLITDIDGTPVPSFDALRAAVLAAEGRALRVGFLRDGERREVTIVPRIEDTPDGKGGFEKRVLIGVTMAFVAGAEVERFGPLGALAEGAGRTWDVVANSVSGILHIVRGEVSASNLQGPIGIAQLSGEMARLGADRLITLIAVISTAIGLLNLMPVPVLDGGHLVFLGIEAARGRPAGDRWVEYASALGLAMVLLLMLFATYNDVLRLIGLA